jgi:hypothetical protein
MVANMEEGGGGFHTIHTAQLINKLMNNQISSNSTDLKYYVW